MLYNIAGLSINFKGDNEYLKRRCISFLSGYSENQLDEYDMKISFELTENTTKPDGEELMGEIEPVIIKKSDPKSGYYIFFNNYGTTAIEPMKPSIIEADTTWSDIRIRYTLNDEILAYHNHESVIKWINGHSFISLNIAFRNLLVLKDGLQIHCASIEYEGMGLIFSAPSGTGKSTHVGLWRELYGSKVTIINEDRPAIRYINNVPMLCGTPWSGTSDNFENKTVPLNNIIILEQAKTNSIERLDATRALPMLAPRCFLPYFDRDLMNTALIILEKLVHDVPVYLLKCRPDYEAVELVRKCLK